jgi:hypothetical protein
MMRIYDVVEKLRSGEALTPKERTIHEVAACGILRDMHDELDALVAEAYGWPWPMEREEVLERLVALHDERVEEEKRGVVRWLRPEYQIPRFAPEQAPAELALGDESAPTDARGGRRTTGSAGAKAERAPWPGTVVEQVAALGGLLAQGPRSVEEAASAFTGAKRDHVARHLETLALMGELSVGEDGRYRSAQKVA